MAIGLGTVQFGMNYGISNNAGIPSTEQIKTILDKAYESGINLLDCAPVYGDVEEKIGNVLNGSNDWRMISKIPKLNSIISNKKNNDFVKSSLDKSLKKLKCDHLYGLLVHDVNDLLEKNGQMIYEELMTVKEAGLVEKIGVSVYRSDQIDNVLDKYDIDLIQIPLNIIDQRLVHNNALNKLKEKSIEIHARSILLQGLLTLPEGMLDNYFNPYKKIIHNFHTASSKLAMTFIELAVSYVSSLENIDELIIGVESSEQLEEIISASNIKINPDELSHLACNDEGLVNPSLWKMESIAI